MNMIIGTNGKEISKREYGIISERHVSVPVRDGVIIDVDVFRPDSKGKFPALLGMSPLHKEFQRDRIWPTPARTSRVRGTPTMDLEAGSTDFYVRRGYVHIIGSARGTGGSGGAYRYRDSNEFNDVYDVIEWAAAQPWCNGNVSMLGIAYFAAQQIPVAMMQPPHLKCIAPMFPFWDDYRHFWWPGGILTAGFLRWFCSLVNMDVHTAESVLREELGDKGFKEAVARALEDKDISADPALVDALKNPDKPGNVALLDILLHPTDTPYWRSRQILDLDAIKVPAYIGVSGHRFGPLYHLSDLKVPKKVVSCPPAYVDKPFYQFGWELLRWYDYWLKGMDTGIMDEPPVRIFVRGANEWLTADDWPLPGTKWTPFNFHYHKNTLCEMEPWPDELSCSYDDAPGNRGSLTYSTTPLVENTEVVGPVILNLYASSRGTDMNFLVSLSDIDPEGKETRVTGGSLKASHRELDPKRSKPWYPFHTHLNPKPLVPGQIYEFNINLSPMANLFKEGHRIVLKITGGDEAPTTAHAVGMYHLCSQKSNTITIYNNAEYPSHLLLPVTRGNIAGTYLSSGAETQGVEKFMQNT